AMGLVRWFRVDFYLPSCCFNPVADGNWYTWVDLHNSITTSEQAWGSWSTSQYTTQKPIGQVSQLGDLSWSGNPKYYGVIMSTHGNGTAENAEFVPLLQLTNADGSKHLQSYDGWHTLLWGMR